MDVLISYPFSIPIPVRRYGLTDVSDEFLVLLSHATQERMKGVVEKLTQISQHRLNVLKVITNTHPSLVPRPLPHFQCYTQSLLYSILALV